MRKRYKGKDINPKIQNVKVPILTLDSRWHELFPDENKTRLISELEQKVNDLLKLQGKLVNDIKDMKNLKKTLVKEIVVNMDIKDDIVGKSNEKKLAQNKRFINELNEKIDNSSEELSELPYKIREANAELLSESIKNCYDRINSNKEDLDKITDWIMNTREKLKNKILIKHDMETTNDKIYAYLHDILGAEVFDMFDENP